MAFIGCGAASHNHSSQYVSWYCKTECSLFFFFFFHFDYSRAFASAHCFLAANRT
jgi:hypothetical protein